MPCFSRFLIISNHLWVFCLLLCTGLMLSRSRWTRKTRLSWRHRRTRWKICTKRGTSYSNSRTQRWFARKKSKMKKTVTRCFSHLTIRFKSRAVKIEIVKNKRLMPTMRSFWMTLERMQLKRRRRTSQRSRETSWFKTSDWEKSLSFKTKSWRIWTTETPNLN